MGGFAKQVWTIGHSTRSEYEFISLLNHFGIRTLVDVRTYPGSRRYPHFNREHMEAALRLEGIAYRHVPELGGRRKPLPDSPNTAWRNPSFRGYADHMQSQEFRHGITRLEELASTNLTAYMCSELLWWKCHRALISDYLKSHGWKVFHIQDIHKFQEHPFTAPARAAQGNLFYS